MINKINNVISLGYGRHLFKEGNAERLRMEIVAKEVGSLHMVVFTSVRDGLRVTTAANELTLYPTNSRFKLLMPLDAFFARERTTLWVAGSVPAEFPSGYNVKTVEDPNVRKKR